MLIKRKRRTYEQTADMQIYRGRDSTSIPCTRSHCRAFNGNSKHLRSSCEPSLNRLPADCSATYRSTTAGTLDSSLLRPLLAQYRYMLDVSNESVFQTILSLMKSSERMTFCIRTDSIHFDARLLLSSRVYGQTTFRWYRPIIGRT